MAIQKILSFLTDLSANNNREWFDENRSRYQEAKTLFEQFTDLLIYEIGQFDSGVHGQRAKDCIFRIIRDVRFSNDKRPYKTNFGAYIAQGGRKSDYSGYYFHLAPDECFLAGGSYMPSAEQLKNIREAIVDDPEFFKSIITNDDFVHHFGELQGEKVKTYPRGFDKDFPDLDLIKFKQYFVSRKISTDLLQSENLIPEAMETYKALKPLNDFINDVTTR